MKHNVVRSLLLILLAGVAMFDIAEGILVLTGVCPTRELPWHAFYRCHSTDALGGDRRRRQLAPAAPRWRRALRPHPPALLRRVVARRVPVAVPHLLLLNRRDNLYTTSMMPS
jgi:hypothetical protein